MRVWILAGIIWFLGAVWVSASPILKWKWWPEEKPASERSGAGRRAGEVWKDPYLGMEFVWVPGGCFKMGCGEWDGGTSDEKPVHEVCVDGFWMGRYEVTVAQWRRFVEETGYGWDEWSCVNKYAPGENHPVVCVSWEDAKAFARWLSRKTGYPFRLPTEAEWEYACRSGGRKVKFGTETGDISHHLANYFGTGGRDRWKYTSPVGSFPPNGLGLYDMSGNVWEWCEDWYDAKYYARSPRRNPKGPSKGKYRVLRGGSWLITPRYLRCAYRFSERPALRNGLLGFRLVRPVASQ